MFDSEYYNTGKHVVNQEKLDNDQDYQNTMVGYAESSVYSLELDLANTKRELRKARADLKKRKTKFEEKFGEYKRSPDTIRSMHFTHNTKVNDGDIYVWDSIISADKESLEDIYGPGGG